MFQTSTVPLHERMWAFMSSPGADGLVVSNMAGIQRATSGGYAFLTDSPLADYTTNRKPCVLTKIEDDIPDRGYAIALPKGHPYR